jgi:hypothetical protein
MIANTKQEFIGCKALWSIAIAESGLSLQGADKERFTIVVNLRVEEPHQLVHLARLLVDLGDSSAPFDGAVLWITTWGVWSTYVEAICMQGIELQRRGLGENRALEAAPVHYFRPHEYSESISMMLWPMLAGWDAFYYPNPSGRPNYFLAISHDGFIDIVTDDEAFAGEVAQKLKTYTWIK